MAKYQLPVASKDTLGGVKIGDHITVENDGTINVDLNSTREEIQNSVDAIKAGKKLLAEAITDKGIPTSSDASFQLMANNVERITLDGSVSNMYLV